MGLATEAARSVLEFAWHESRRSKVYAGHHPDNRALQKWAGQADQLLGILTR
jgi:RimJ/RimL family protein N-acetyltransferase